ncbi:polyprenyl synthetase family protein [Alicyclobacillus sp. SO9]|uniref:polyprenyl synthetase family protein n=1 Tax=Alicyclobacillus sp. SO9 TaxID=2665646 RepID=UPI0018E8EE27|nr:polyprenyl synthetase family protein [Alicyclobacillus sp. SO9]
MQMQFIDSYKRYRAELDNVESLLSNSVESGNTKLTQSAKQLLKAGGKRIRPLFALMCSQFGDGMDRQAVYSVAASLEMIHMASLVHDDVIDDASVRRGKPTVRSTYGDRAAMYTGDFLFARAIRLMSNVSDLRIHREMSDAIVRLCEGEIDQIRDFYNWEQNVRNYLRRVERKTALLISISCSLGARAGNADDETVRRLRRFGYYTGMAFQITDDLLDLEGDEQVVGKPVGGDLQQGNLTLPTLYAGRGENARELRTIVRENMNKTTVLRAVEIIKATGGLQVARDLANRYLEKALKELETLRPHQAVDDLTTVSNFVNRRAY